MKNRAQSKILIVSVLAFFICLSMFIGSTFAWFTDGVTSDGNVIKSGTLKVGMYWADGTEDPETVTWKESKNGAMFYGVQWEPGFTEVRHIKIENEGSLALKYQMGVEVVGTVSILAEVIDIYYVDPAVQITDRTQLTESNKVGTLEEVINGTCEMASGNLQAEHNDVFTIAFAMRENVGNEYQDLSFGSSFAIQILATQYTFEADGFNDRYDQGAEFPQEIVSSAFKMLHDPNMTVRIDGDEIVLSYNGVVQGVLPKECVERNDNVLTVTNAGEYNGVYTIYDNGFLEKDGEIIAKSELIWVDGATEDSSYMIVHEGVIYFSEDGNIPVDTVGSFEQVGQVYNALVSAYIGDTDEFYELYGYRFSEYTGEFTVENYYDLLFLEEFREDEYKEKDWRDDLGVYDYWGGSAINEKTDNALLIKAHWRATDLDAVITTKGYVLTANGRQEIPTSAVIENGTYELETETKYYHNGVETENVIFFEDYALYFEDGMTYGEWMHTYMFTNLHDLCKGDHEHAGIYIPKQYLDQPCEPGYREGYDRELRSPLKTINNPNLGYQSNGQWIQEFIYYSYGKAYIKPTEFNETGYEFAGMAWVGGVQTEGWIYADEFYNYFIEDLGINTDDIQIYATNVAFDTAFKPTNEDSVVDISEYLTRNGSNQIVVDWTALEEDFGITGSVTTIPVYEQDGYLVDCRYNTTNATGITFYYNGVVYTGFVD